MKWIPLAKLSMMWFLRSGDIFKMSERCDVNKRSGLLVRDAGDDRWIRYLCSTLVDRILEHLFFKNICLDVAVCGWRIWRILAILIPCYRTMWTKFSSIAIIRKKKWNIEMNSCSPNASGKTNYKYIWSNRRINIPESGRIIRDFLADIYTAQTHYSSWI